MKLNLNTGFRDWSEKQKKIVHSLLMKNVESIG